jgi:CheY-like chemotaxis protein
MEYVLPSQDYVLIVDDEPHVRRVLAQKLSGAGLAVAVASDGADALATALARPPCLVITDCRMPAGMSGSELAARLHADPRTTHVPVVMLTAFPEETPPSSAGGTNIRAVEVKPFSPRAILGIVARLLRESRAA